MMVMISSRFVFLTLVLFLLIPISSAELVFFSDGTQYNKTMPYTEIVEKFRNSSHNDPIVVFYDHLCISCQETIKWLNSYQEQHPDVKIVLYDLYKNAPNQVMFEEYMNKYNQSAVHVPTAFIGPAGLEGNETIKVLFEPFSLLYSENFKEK